MTLRASAGPLVFVRHGSRERVQELVVAAGERATVVRERGGGFELRTVEHLCAALAGLGIYDGVEIEVSGGEELPLLDGGALAWTRALRSLRVASSPPRLVVAASARLYRGESVYQFDPPPRDVRGHSGSSARVEARLVFDNPRLSTEACWDGTAKAFEERVAPARTFGFAREVAWLSERGLARGATAESVVVVGDRDLVSAGRPAELDEPARHKLLDLIGDLYLYGGPPAGVVRALRPGHAATHAVVVQALAEGVLAFAP